MAILLGMKDIATAGALDRELIPEVRRNARRNAPIERVEVITRGARRRWSVAEKRSIVLASLEPGVVVSAICRRHEISRGQLSAWRQLFREGALGGDGEAGGDFARAVVADPTVTHTQPAAMARLESGRMAAPRRSCPSRQGRGADSRIEIALPGGAVVRVGSTVDQWALARVLAALRDNQ